MYIVLRILLRLAEEVSDTDNNLQAARRKDMNSAFQNILEKLFKFFVETLQLNVDKMKKMVCHRMFAMFLYKYLPYKETVA